MDGTSHSTKKKLKKMERTLLILKPSCYERGLVGEIISRVERKGYELVQLRIEKLSDEKARKLYEVHEGKSFFADLMKVMTNKPVVLLVVEGPQAISVLRSMIGTTNPLAAEPGTIRGDYSSKITDNLIHASDSPERYEREVKIFFAQEDLETA